MPFIHIKSLPFEKDIDIPEVLKGISSDFSSTLGIELQHIHTTWEYYRPGYYAKGANVSDFQPERNFPIIIDLLTPDFNDQETVSSMLKIIAKSLSQRASFPMENIFINHRYAKSGMVFDDGEIVYWE